MDAETAEALEGGIKKWTRIVRSTRALDKAAFNCDLCKLFLDDDCGRCPVSVRSGAPNCDGTPFADWFDHHDDEHDFVRHNHRRKGCKKCLELAKAELEFLKSFREPKGE